MELSAHFYVATATQNLKLKDTKLWTHQEAKNLKNLLLNYFWPDCVA